MVFDPDLSNEHENVLRAMLAGTNRKVRRNLRRHPYITWP